MDEIRQDPDVLYLRFEEIVSSYDESVGKILDFLGLSPLGHRDKKRFFDPAASAKNIGIWKDFLSQREIDALEGELEGYLWN